MSLPRGHEFSGLLRVLACFVAAQRTGRGLCSEDLLAAEPFLTDDLLQRYLGDLHRVGLIQRNELGEWVVVRDPESIELLEIYREGDYRLATDAAAPAASTPPAAALLAQLGEHVRATLAVPLAVLFPREAAEVPSPSVQELPTEHP